MSAKAPTQKIRLIVGLGNPGAEYANTRHNAGQDLVEELAAQEGSALSLDSKHFGLTARIHLSGQDIRLLVPTTFMNRSGQSVTSLAQFFKIQTEEILVIHDELDLAPGVARAKIGGGHGGHNGLRDIISALGNNKGFARLRIGIGHPGSAPLVSNYVLKKAPQTEAQKIEDAITASIKHIPNMVSGEWEAAMRELHSIKH